MHEEHPTKLDLPRDVSWQCESRAEHIGSEEFSTGIVEWENSVTEFIQIDSDLQVQSLD